jgi:two-component system CheB/CheR fusion protein
MKKNKQSAEKKDSAVKKNKTVKKESLKTTGSQPEPGIISPLHAGFPIVGIGASAGGLAAFESFFSGMPADIEPDMAFVLVQHLDPDHKSILTDLIRRYTRMQVFEVEDGMVVKPNCAYIIPPGRDMAFLNGTLQLLEPSAPRGHRLPIDFFFRSLAQDQHERAICIVLSGTGNDGSLGVRAIKGEGGMVMAQNPESVKYDGMPRSAIATGMVDYILPPVEMPLQLIAYVLHAFGKLPPISSVIEPNIENGMKKICVILRAQTGHDFSQYKPTTLHRRIGRRMSVHQVDSMDDYIKYLQQAPIEVETLFRDLLIGVTSFFRDPEAFQALENHIIHKLFSVKSDDEVIRVWVPGCSTGEEAYSIAIIMQERHEVLKQNCRAQIFATDIDSQAIATARAGVYPASIADDITPERLSRFFTAEPDSNAYRIHKNIRDMLIFSEQDVIKDPPFSKLDLISCRNMMIYMGGDLQKKLIPLFHYSLNPGGMLFLGTSETIGSFEELFTVLDRKLKIYQRKEDFQIVYDGRKKRADLTQFIPPLSAEILPRTFRKKTISTRLPLRELTEQALLQQVVPASALVNETGNILYLHGRTGMYLEPAQGETGIYNILKMAREGLRLDLAMALKKAVKLKEVIHCPDLRVKTNGNFTRVNLTIRPVAAGPETTLDTPLYLVLMEEAVYFKTDKILQSVLDCADKDDVSGAVKTDPDTDSRIIALMNELKLKEEHLQAVNEQIESSNDELQSSNEEMQSVNEELQSTNEEMETSKEELQSVNEELATVNVELQTKVVDLSRANNDMNNLLAGTGIGTVFVDHALRILRFTPSVTRIINLIQSDEGRPVGHIVSRLVGYDHLVEDVQSVLDTLVSKEIEVQTTAGAWYTMRILPYRTLDNVIEGAVITFVDITEMKQAKEELIVSEIRYRRLFETAQVGMLILDAETGKIMNVNPFLIKMLGYSEEQFVEKAIWEIGLFKDIAANRENFLELQQKEYIRYEDLPLETADGRLIEVEFISNVYSVENHKVIQCDIRDITERKRAEEELRKANDLLRLAVVVRDAHDAITVQDLDGRIIAWNPGAVRMYGWMESEALLMNVRDLIPENLRDKALAMVHQLSLADILEPYHTQRIAKDGTVVEISMVSTALLNETGNMYAISTTERAIESKTDRMKEGNAG